MTLRRGDAVLVPFGHRTIVGFVESIGPLFGTPEYSIRPIQERVEGIALPESILELLDFVADEFAVTQGAAFSAAIPPGIRTRLNTYYEGNGEGVTPGQTAIVSALARRGRLSERALKATAGFTESGLRALLATNVVRQTVGIPREQRKAGMGLILSEGHAARQFISDQGSKKPAQAQCLAALLETPPSGLSIAEITALASVSEATVKALLDTGLLITAAENGANPAPTEKLHRLNPDQARAVSNITLAIRKRGDHRFLLYGVTGSGKT